jgi:large subunit ribosomal protein L4
VFGPHPRDYGYRLPKQARRAALLSALSLKHQQARLIVVDKLELAEGKTKLMRKVLESLQVHSVLIVLSESNPKVELASRNLPNLKVLKPEGLNVYDLLRYEHLIMTEAALREIEQRLAA